MCTWKSYRKLVGSEHGRELSVAITLLMAGTSGMVQPFLQPQARKESASDIRCSTCFNQNHLHDVLFLPQESVCPVHIWTFVCSTPGDQCSPMLLFFVPGSGISELQLSHALVAWQLLLGTACAGVAPFFGALTVLLSRQCPELITWERAKVR